MNDAHEVIEILVNELDKHGFGDLHTVGPKCRVFDVRLAVSVGRNWLVNNPKENNAILS